MDPPEKPKILFREIYRKYFLDSDSGREEEDEFHHMPLSSRKNVFCFEKIGKSLQQATESDEEYIDSYVENFDRIPFIDRSLYDSDEGSSDEDEEDESDATSDASDDSNYSEISSASKYRSVNNKRIKPPTKGRNKFPGIKWRITNPTPGALVWALLPAQYGVPWWPAVIIDKNAVYMKTKKLDDVVAYRVLLICPPNQLAFIGSFYVKGSNLLSLKTKQDFDDFMKASVSAPHRQLYNISQFQIPPAQESHWHAAQRIYFLVAQSPASNLSARMLQLGLSLSEYQKIWAEEDLKRKEVLVPIDNSSQRREIPRVKTLRGRQVSGVHID